MTISHKITDRYGRDKIAPKYAALEAEWYQKLADSGFVDIEPYGTPLDTYLRDHHIESTKRMVRGVETGKAEYFRLLYEWLDIGHHRSRAERWALSALCEGFDCREITARFNIDMGTSGALAKRLANRGERAMKHFGVA